MKFMKAKSASLARRGVLGALVLVMAFAEQASGQCMWWDPLPSPAGQPWPTSLRVFDLGGGPQLFITYGTEAISGQFLSGVSRWTGSSWALVGNANFDTYASCLESYDSGTGPHLYVGGSFYNASAGYPVERLAMLTNGIWVSIGLPTIPATPSRVYALKEFDDGQGPKLYVGGYFLTSAPYGGYSLVTWNGSSWGGVGGGIDAGTGVPDVWSMCVFDDGSGSALYVGGHFISAGGVTLNNIAKWNGTNWSALGSGLSRNASALNAMCQSMAVFDDGTGPALYVGGTFDHAGGVLADGMAKWDGSNWAALPGLYGTVAQGLAVHSIASHDDGSGPSLYAGFGYGGYIGGFIGQAQVWGVARWDDHSWSSLGGGFGGIVAPLASFDDGQGAGPALWLGGFNYYGFVGGNLPGVNLARWYGGCTHGIDPMCFGDGSFAPCPCGNYGSSLHGCANSASSQGALLSATGTTNPDTLVLQSAGEHSSSLTIFLQSSALLPVQASYGEGILCLGREIRPMYVKAASGGVAQAPGPGDRSITQLSATLGDPIVPGTARYYQAWYRDGGSGYCSYPRGFNISNGLRVVW